MKVWKKNHALSFSYFESSYKFQSHPSFLIQPSNIFPASQSYVPVLPLFILL